MSLFGYHDDKRSQTPSPIQLAAGYAICRSISRAVARNFYYGFLALPREKRDAICAVYAFMRHADDISDEPELGVPEKRERLADWLTRLHRVIAGEPTDDPVLLALGDAQQRYKIPAELFDRLVAGTAMDLEDSGSPPDKPGFSADAGTRMPEPCLEGAAAPGVVLESSPAAISSVPTAATVLGSPRRAAAYATFADLYQYCYHVASVVGLICIRIFGYRDSAAEPLAEHCGIAFQLTNIIRDVKEDASMGRVYLPQEDLDRFAVNPAELCASAPHQLASRFREILDFEARRARDFYRAADELLPLVDEDSRPALWVLVTIYRRLLEKIAARNYDVFSERIRLSMPEKLRILAKGLWLRLT